MWLTLAFLIAQLWPFPGPGRTSSAPLATAGFVSNNQGASAQTMALTTKTGNGCPTDAYCTQNVNPSLAGNTIIIGVTYGNATSSIPTISDDQGNTYSRCSTEGHDATNNRWVDVFYKIGAATGTRKIAVTWATGVTHAQTSVAEFNNINAFDVCNGNGSGTAGTTFTSGSMTTTASNDLLYTFAIATNPATDTGSFTGGSQAGITWNLLGPDRRDGSVAQFGTLSSAGAINPQLTVSSAAAFAAVTIALKSASTGTAPSGMYVACMQSYNAANSSTGPYANQIGCPVGNLLVGEMNGGYPQVVTSVVGSTNGTWTQCGANATAGVSGDPITAVYYVSSPTTTNENVTINTTGTADTSMWFYSIAGASTKKYCGQQTEIATNPGLSGSSITPFSDVPGSVTSGMTIISYGQFSNTAIALTAPSSSRFDSNFVGGQSIDGPSVPDENNLRGHASAVPTAQTWTLTETATGGGGVSAGEIDSFPAPGAVFTAAFNSGQATGTATLNVAVTTLNAGEALVVAVGMYNGSTGRTVSKVCIDGATCAAGNSFTQATNAATTANAGEANTDIWYLLNAGSAGSKTVTVTLSGSASNVEASVYAVDGISAFDVANHINGGTGGAGNVDTGASVTTTGSPGFVVGCIGVSDAVNQQPASGNEFINGGVIYSNTKDAASSLLSTSAASHTPAWLSTSGNPFNASTAAFK